MGCGASSQPEEPKHNGKLGKDAEPHQSSPANTSGPAAGGKLGAKAGSKLFKGGLQTSSADLGGMLGTTDKLHMQQLLHESSADLGAMRAEKTEKVVTEKVVTEKAFEGEAFKCSGQWALGCREHYDEEMAYYSDPANAPQPVPELAVMFRQGLDYFVPQDDAHKEFDERITIEAREAVGGPEYDPQAVVGSALIHRVTGKPDTGRKCMIYFHGGGGVAGTAEQMKSIVNRYAFECDCTIVSYNYRVAPEARMPCCIYDCYAAIKWVIANADNLGIDKERIAIFGESGGGYVTAAAAVYLADKGEGDLVKLQFPQLPMVNDMYFMDDWSAFSEVEKAQGPMTKCLGSLWVEDIEAHRSNPLVFPVKASVETVRKMPKAVVLTTEFDSLKRPAMELAALYEEGGILLEPCGVLAGCAHGQFVHYDLLPSNEWFGACARVSRIYL